VAGGSAWSPENASAARLELVIGQSRSFRRLNQTIAWSRCRTVEASMARTQAALSPPRSSQAVSVTHTG
jgi:hypothetical protein